jgi:Flp pilus assembly protein TadG
MRVLKRLKNNKGQSLVETALVLPIILLLFCGIVDVGWVVANELVAENGCREGARLAAVAASDANYVSEVSSRVMAVTPGYAHSGISVTTTLTNPAKPTDGDVKVTVTFTFRLLTPMAQTILGKQNFTTTSTCIMKAE